MGLNSGQVIAGEIGSGSLGYTAIGEQVGMAQRMESVAPPGGVMLSESTARLVEHTAIWVSLSWCASRVPTNPVPARRLVAIARGMAGRARRVESGRSALGDVRRRGLVGPQIDGHGACGGVVGPPGIGKSRLVREVAAMAAGRGVEVFTAFCESHARDIPFDAVARLLRAGSRRRGSRRRSGPRSGCATMFPMPTRRICCCSTTCWASPTPRWRCRRSIRMRVGGG